MGEPTATVEDVRRVIAYLEERKQSLLDTSDTSRGGMRYFLNSDGVRKIAALETAIEVLNGEL